MQARPSRPLHVDGYQGQPFFNVDTTLPTDPRLVDTSRMMNGRTPTEYAQLFSRLPIALERALRQKGNLEVSITVDEKGNLVPYNSKSKNAPLSIQVSAMIKENKDGTYSMVGIWGGYCGGGNNGAAAPMSMMKMMSTKEGREALRHKTVLEEARYDWKNARYVTHGSLNRDKKAWAYADGSPTTFIPFTCNNTYGKKGQSALGEHHKRIPNSQTWGCSTGSDESFRARMNSRIAVMMGDTPVKHDRANGLGLQNKASVAAHVFYRNKSYADTVLNRNVYYPNPLMFKTGNPRFDAYTRQVQVPAMRHTHDQPTKTHKPAPQPAQWTIRH